MKRTLRHVQLASLVAGLALAGCASTPPELTAARIDAQQASGGELATAASSDLAEARNAISEADACIERNGDEQVARDLAYVAARRLERARIIASTNRQIDQPDNR